MSMSKAFVNEPLTDFSSAGEHQAMLDAIAKVRSSLEKSVGAVRHPRDREAGEVSP